MDKEPFQKLAEQSEEEFRKQFDPTSETFHGGSNVPVPLNGDRIPESMPGMYPEGYDPSKVPEVVDYGEGYRKVEVDRAVYQDLKKQLAKLCPIVEAILRHEQIFKEKGDPTNQKHVKVHEDNMKKEAENLSQVQKQLQEFIPKLQSIDEEGEMLAKDLFKIIEDSHKKYTNKESLTDFNFKVKKLSATSFSNAQKCLQKLKEIKKIYAAKKKEEASKQEEKPAEKKEE